MDLNSTIIKKDRDSINIFNEALVKVANIAKGGLKEYEMQFEMVENFYSMICQELKIDHVAANPYFENIKKTIDAIYELQELSPKALDRILANSAILSKKIFSEYPQNNQFFVNKQINCLIAGNGVVGSSVIQIIKSQRDYLTNHGFDLKIIGGFTSKKYFVNGDFSAEGIDYKSFDEVIAEFKKKAGINHVLIDCTSSDLLVENYQKFIEEGFNIVTPNKKANSLDLKKFEHLQEILKENRKLFFYEANVGAGLPVISTIKDLIDCGDEIIKIEGILSGTLSYIFNNLNAKKKFSEIVLDAKEKGFTEPDPNEDLCGIDVGRKLLILSRIIGYKINLADVEIQSLVDFSDEEVAVMVEEAEKNNQILRYVGVIENNKAYSKIIAVDTNDVLASTQYSDNIIAITTKFYNKTPLAIRGPGAGADVTAIGVVSDLIKLSKLL